MERDEEDEGPFEPFGSLRLPLQPDSASGYVGVQRSASKKRPWQATVKVPGRKRINIGSFRTPQEAAVARARAKAEGPELLPSPRKQAARGSGALEARPCLPSLCAPDPLSIPFSPPRSTRAVHHSQATDGHDPHAPHAPRRECS